MTSVVFVVPYALDTTLRFVEAAADLPGVRLGILSQEKPERLPESLRHRIAGHVQVLDCMDTRQLESGLRRLSGSLEGRVDRLIGILEQAQVPLAEVRERLGIRGMSVNEARNFRDKARMKDVLRAAGLPCARHGLAESAAAALAFADDAGYPLVVKPPAGAGAKNTVRIEEREQLEQYVRALPPQPGAPLLLEEFITGREHSFDSVSVNGQHVFHSISHYYPSPLEVVESPWIQWCVVLPRKIDGPEYADIVDTGRRALDALGMVTGMTHMEWFRKADGSLALSEVAARPPGAQFTSLISWAHDRDFYRIWAEVVTFERFTPPERNYAVGAAYLRGRGGGRVKAVKGLEEARRELGNLIVEAALPKPGQPAASSYEGEGHVILRHAETEAVEDGLRRLLALVEIELE